VRAPPDQRPIAGLDLEYLTRRRTKPGVDGGEPIRRRVRRVGRAPRIRRTHRRLIRFGGQRVGESEAIESDLDQRFVTMPSGEAIRATNASSRCHRRLTGSAGSASVNRRCMTLVALAVREQCGWLYRRQRARPRAHSVCAGEIDQRGCLRELKISRAGVRARTDDREAGRSVHRVRGAEPTRWSTSARADR
jgi:hypothetical protein